MSYCSDGLRKSAPNIVILCCLANDLKALVDVNDVINASSFHSKLQGYLIQFEDEACSALEVVDEAAAQLLQALLLSVVGEYLLPEKLSARELFGAAAIPHEEDGASGGQKLCDEISLEASL